MKIIHITCTLPDGRIKTAHLAVGRGGLDRRQAGGLIRQLRRGIWPRAMSGGAGMR